MKWVKLRRREWSNVSMMASDRCSMLYEVKNNEHISAQRKNEND